MRSKTPQTALAASLLFSCIASPALQGAVIYEPFADGDTSLAGNATGSGLTGNWLGDTRTTVTGSGLTFGSLQTTANAATANGSWYGNNAAITSTTEYNALLASGGELWFSMLYRKDAGNGRFYFTIGSGGVTNNGNLDSGVQAIGFGSTGSNLYAGLWETNIWSPSNNLQGPAATSVDVTGDSTVNSADSGSLAGETTYFIVGHAQWGATAGDDDVVTLYLPDSSNLAVLGDAVARSVGQVDQSTFNLISTNHGNNVTTRWDEIRVGASYADVSPVSAIPEPSIAILGGLAPLLLIRRRK